MGGLVKILLSKVLQWFMWWMQTSLFANRDFVGLNFVIPLALFAKKFQLIDLQTTGLNKINEFDLKPVINLRL